MTPNEAIEIVYERLCAWHDYISQFETQRYRAAMQAEHDEIIATLRHYLIPRTEPPTVEEVGDDKLCLGLIDRDDAKGVPALWASVPGKDVRDFWGPGYSAWLPVPKWEVGR